MSSDGIYLVLRIGKNVPEPAPALLMDAVQKVVVTTSDSVKNTGFQIVFSVGRNNTSDKKEYALLDNPLIKPFNRVIILVSFGVTSKVLIDGIITNHQFNPSFEPGKSTFTITGLDLSVIMSLEQKKRTIPNQSDADIAATLIESYAEHGLKPKIVAPDSIETPMENVSVPSQTAITDLDYICQLAQKYHGVFFIEPTDVVGKNIAYWGRPDRKGKPQQKALSFNMGEFSNVSAIDFEMNVLKQSKIEDKIQSDNEASAEVKSASSGNGQKLAAQSVVDFNKEMTVIKKLPNKSALSLAEAYNRAREEELNTSTEAVKVLGELDSTRYGDILRAGHLATLRGVGQSYNGLYYVKQVTHTITKGTYKQKFTLTREGTGTTIQKV